MGTLLERELIKKDFEEKYPILIQMMNKELDKAKEIYDNQVQIKKEKGKIPIHKNMPAVTGGLKWAQELKQRISEPMGHYKRLEHPYVYLVYFTSCLPMGLAQKSGILLELLVCGISTAIWYTL